MKLILHPLLKARFASLYYQFRFLGLYIIIGIISLFLEILLRYHLFNFGIKLIPTTLISISSGILFAFWANVKFNFKIPKSRRNRSLLFFVGISCFSGLLQLFIISVLPKIDLRYETGRFLISGTLFLLAYFLHRRFSFRDFKQVGIAIYSNGVEDLSRIHEKIGQYPDFIHVDILDKTMNDSAEEIQLYRLETIKAFWPNCQVHSHIMSQYPSKWVDQILPYSDIIYFHAECKENLYSLVDKIQKSGRKAGVALTMQTEPKDVIPLLKKSNAVLLLTVQKPGKSGQHFDIDGLDRIKQVNSLPFRHRIQLCIDGGVNENIVGKLDAENIVSGSSVLTNPDPKKQIMLLQTVGRYESV